MTEKKSNQIITVDRMDDLMRLVFRELARRGGSGRPKEVLSAIASQADFTSHELETTKTGATRWDTHIRFYSTDCAKAGFLTKDSGIWNLTDAGEAALKLPRGQLLRSASKAYRLWRQDQAGEEEPQSNEVEDEASDSIAQDIYEKAVEDARAGIDSQIDSLDGYEFQQLIAELLKAMGYYVRHVSPPGPDGGLDILAFRDPLGTQTPHIKVQVKHRVQKLDAMEVRQLAGILHKDSDIGLLVSSSGFTRDADREIAQASKHLDKIDRDRLLVLWKQHYDRLSERGRRYLPLIQVYFLAPPEE